MTARSINQKRLFAFMLGLAAGGLIITVHLAIELWSTRVFSMFGG